MLRTILEFLEGERCWQTAVVYTPDFLGSRSKSSIPFSVSIMFREIIGLLISIKNLIYKEKLKQK